MIHHPTRRTFLRGAVSGAVGASLISLPAFAADAPAKLKLSMKYDSVNFGASVQERFEIIKSVGFQGVEINSPSAINRDEAKQASENLELAEGRYETGVGNVIELTDAQTQRASAEADRVRALYDYQVAVAALEQAIGRELPSP